VEQLHCHDAARPDTYVSSCLTQQHSMKELNGVLTTTRLVQKPSLVKNEIRDQRPRSSSPGHGAPPPDVTEIDEHRLQGRSRVRAKGRNTRARRVLLRRKGRPHVCGIAFAPGSNVVQHVSRSRSNASEARARAVGACLASTQTRPNTPRAPFAPTQIEVDDHLPLDLHAFETRLADASGPVRWMNGRIRHFGWAGSPFAGRGSHPLDDDNDHCRSFR